MDDTNAGKGCRCPFCDAVLPDIEKICSTCKVVLIKCGRCGLDVKQGTTHCPGCGLPLEEK